MSEDNYLHEIEREEARDARQFAPLSAYCYRHTYVSDRRGGGVCRDCGDEISRDEL